MFDIELPDFFRNNNISELFVDDTNNFIDFKTSDYFGSDSLSEFSDLIEEMENELLRFTNLLNQKVELFEKTKKVFEKNNENLRDLNSQVSSYKVNDLTFGFSKPGDDFESEIDQILGRK